jgi:O-antigen ligase
MRLRAEIAAWGSMIFLLLLLVLMSTLGTAGMVIAGALAVGLTVVVALGPDRTGIVMLIAALGTAPMNAFRPPGAGVVTFSDVFFALGFGLLLPRLLRNRSALPPMFYIGSGLFLVGGLFASAFMPSPITGVFGVARFVIAAMVLPLLMSMLRPTRNVLTWLAAAYVLGQMVSTAYAYIHPIEVQGRSFGWTRHPNFFGMGGHTAFALLIFLFYRLPPRRRWVLIIPAAVVGQSVLMSGSRASLLCIALMAVLWPIVERTAISWYLIVSVGVVGLALANPILSSAGNGSALARIQGGASGALSNEARVQALTSALKEFVHSPIIGHGFSADTLLVHNAYLEAGLGGGILAMLGFVLIVGTLVAPLFRDRMPNRLAFVALSYAAFAMIGPSLWDRIVWAALALVFVREQDPTPEAADPPALAVTPRKALTR